VQADVAMAEAVLTHEPASIDDDLPEVRYHFPRAYLRQVEAVVGDFVIDDEPRRTGLGDRDRTGRRSCIAVAQVQGIEADRDRTDHFDALLEPGPYLAFDRPVPYTAAGAASDLADWIGVEVRYGRPGLGMVFDRALLDTPGRGGSPGFAELRRLVQGAAAEDLTRALVDVVELRLASGEVALDGAATRLGLRSRTLQRQLQAEGISYRQDVDIARRSRAETALATTTTPIAEIATSLGYDEPAHFTRAFRRWHGCSPSQWRHTRRVL